MDLLPLPALSALIKRCNIFISPDTGAMHLSAAVGTPTLALFLNSDPVMFGPMGDKNRIIKSDNGTISVEKVKDVFRETVQSQMHEQMK